MLKNISIKRLMQVTTFNIVVILLAVMLVNRWQLAVTDSELDRQEQLTQAVLALKDTRYFVVQIQQFLTDVAATGDEQVFAEAQESLAGAMKGLDRLSTVVPELAHDVSELRGQVERLHRIGTDMAYAYIREGREAGNAIMKRPGNGLDDASTRLAENLESIAGELSRRLEAAVTKAQGHMHQAEVIIATLSIVLLVLIPAAMVGLYRKVIPPLEILRCSMNDVARGSRDLTVSIEVKGRDEIAEVAHGFNHFVENIHDLVAQVAGSALRLASSGDQMSQASDETLKGMRHLHDATGEMVEAMAQMAAAVQEVAGAASGAAESAQHSNEEAQKGQAVVSDTIAVIQRLADEVQEAGKVINQLATDAENIGSILDVIRGIAEQTNLLALNAAIEAARAGDQGRGFAVVADEVRTLAQRTQGATSEIQQMIEQLQRGARRAVTVMEEGGVQATRSVEQARSAGQSLDAITRMAADICDRTARIASSAEEQSAVAEGVNRNVAAIGEVADQTTDNAHTSASIAGSMGELMAELTGSVRQFKVDHDGALDLSRAKTAHLSWKSRLRAFLDGTAALTEEQAVSHHHCDFGKWYYSEGLGRFGHLPALREVEEPHAELHRLIKEIILAKRQGRADEAEATYRRVEPLSKRIVGLLEQVERQAAAKGV